MGCELTSACPYLLAPSLSARGKDTQLLMYEKQFTRHLKIPYCSLYDMGYTSLGGTTDTHPNPALKAEAEGERKKFRPAYELMEDHAERLGRDR
jgi:hypothetical protein